MLEEIENWGKIQSFVEDFSGKRPESVDVILFLIGVQELGQGVKNFSKEQKQDLMHIAVCKIFSLGGFYELTHTDEEGWPHYKSIEKVPHRKMLLQEGLIKEYIVKYFEHNDLI